MNLTQIESNLKILVQSFDKETFIYRLLESYFLPKASISRLQKGTLNLSKVPGEVSWKKKVFFKEELNDDLHLTISALKGEIKHSQRFLIVTDYATLLAIDTLTKDQLDISLADLPKYYDFFLPWAGMEKAKHASENPADVKAAEKMAKLFDEIKKDNPDTSAEFIHTLNIFFSRLLFCYFAEDTNIFEDNQFSHAVESHTRGDGSDLDTYLNRLFWVLNTPVDKRGDIPHYLNAFPYVNGGLFKEEIPSPKFTTKSRQLLIESGDSNDWSTINPDIFGSMFQAVISPEHRGGLGAHYTSVPNIMKVIEPLFLNDLKEAFEDAIGSEKKLKELLYRISKIKLFDPACGSGNFLIIAYKELRRLEMRILKELGGFTFSGIHLNNFYGIELDDFAHEIAKLSLWLAEHQMNVEFFNEFGRTNPTLPLQEAGQIVCGNACRLDWGQVCPKNEVDEIYVLGNPPYLGQRNQKEIHRKDLDMAFLGQENYKNLDYVSAWFYLGSKYISNSRNKLAFVSTNSITQGTQVKMLWDKIFLFNTEIDFAYKDFKWSNNAKSKANVTVCIIGLSNKNNNKKALYVDDNRISTNSISPFLTVGASIIIPKRNTPLSSLSQMIGGNQPREGGFLILNEIEKNKLSNEYPGISRFFRKLVGNTEFVNGTKKWCIWINQNELNDALKYEEIARRVHSVKLVREQGNSLEKNFVNFSYRFVQINEAQKHQIVIPVLSSERRQYLPIGFYDKEAIVLGSVNVIFDPDIFIFGILSSTMHYLWAKEFSLKYASNIKYSIGICFNTFPFPESSTSQKNTLQLTSLRIIEERERFSQFSISELYDPDKMPEGLKEAHRLNDEAVDRCYRSTPFNSDEERLEYLFKLYEKMIQEEKEKGTLFEVEKKTRKKK